MPAAISQPRLGARRCWGRAVFNGNLGLAKLLIEMGADPVAQQFGNGQSLVDSALEEGHKDIAKYLEDVGVERG
jgi:ankyrin repeat protein